MISRKHFLCSAVSPSRNGGRLRGHRRRAPESILRKGVHRRGRMVRAGAPRWLYPTHVHEPLRPEARPAPRAQTPRRIGYPSARLWCRHGFLARPERSPDGEFMSDQGDDSRRFKYRRPPLIFLVRAFRASVGHESLTAEHPCKSWVPIEPPLSTAGLVPVLDDRILDPGGAAMNRPESLTIVIRTQSSVGSLRRAFQSRPSVPTTS